LRRSHFEIGGDAFTQGTLMKSSYRPLSASMALLNKEKKAELRASHWGVGHKESAPSFVTSNMMQFKWVQPTPNKLK
jgi:hypothetical protein